MNTVSEREDSPALIEFRAHVRHRLGPAIGIACIILAAALLGAACLPPRFMSTAVLTILPAPEFTVREEAGTPAFSTAALDMEQMMKAEAGILESEDLHDHTIERLGFRNIYPDLDPEYRPSFIDRITQAAVRTIQTALRGSPADPRLALRDRALRRFANDLRVLPAKDSNVINVTFSHAVPAVAAGALNMMLQQYAERRRKLYDDPQLGVVRLATDELERAVQVADNALTAYKIRCGISDGATQRALLLQRQSDVAAALANADAANAEQQARMSELDHQVRALSQAVPLYTEKDSDTRLQAIDAVILELRGRIATAKLNYRDRSRKVTDLVEQLRMRETDRQRMAALSEMSLTRTGRSAALDPLLVDRAHAKAEASAAVVRAASLRGELGTIDAALAELNRQEITLSELTRRKTVAESNYTSASRVLEERRITEAEDTLRMSNVRVIQPARIPQHPTATRLLICIAGAFFGPIVSVAWLLLGYAIRPTFLTAEGLAHATGLPVLAVFPLENSGTAIPA